MNISFGSVTPIIAKPGGLKALGEDLAYQIEKKYPYELTDLTSLYQNTNSEGDLYKAAAEGNEIGALVTGSEYKKMLAKSEGWENEPAVAQHMDRVVERINKKFGAVLDRLIIRITTDK